MSSHTLVQCASVLLSLSGVVAKYRAILVNGLLQLFYMDATEANTFLRQMSVKWPTTNPKKAMEWLQLLDDLIQQCHMLTSREYGAVMTSLIRRMMRIATESHVNLSLQALSLLSSSRVITSFIVPYPEQVTRIEHCIELCRSHWNEAVQEKAECLFDVLLDYLEY